MRGGNIYISRVRGMDSGGRFVLSSLYPLKNFQVFYDHQSFVNYKTIVKNVKYTVTYFV